MHIKKIMSFIALAIFSSATIFANVNNEKPIEKSSFDSVNNESKKNDLDIKKEIDKLPKTPDEKKEIKNNSFAYINFDATYIIPSHIGLGYRKKINNNGYDFGIASSPVPLFFLSGYKIIPVDIHGSYLKYFPSNNTNNYYSILGLNLKGTLSNKSWLNKFSLSPSFGWGKQFNSNKNPSFFEGKMSWPHIPLSKHNYYELAGPVMMVIPVVTISYGFGF